MLLDEKEAAAEIRALSGNAKALLQHMHRNFLQTILSALEMGEYDVIRDKVFENSHELKRLDL